MTPLTLTPSTVAERRADIDLRFQEAELLGNEGFFSDGAEAEGDAREDLMQLHEEVLHEVAHGHPLSAALAQASLNHPPSAPPTASLDPATDPARTAR